MACYKDARVGLSSTVSYIIIKLILRFSVSTYSTNMFLFSFYICYCIKSGNVKINLKQEICCNISHMGSTLFSMSWMTYDLHGEKDQ